MHILITGAAGFIGSNLAKRLLDSGHEVTGIDNFSYGFERNIAELKPNSKFHFIEGDVKEKSVFEGTSPDVIVHLASQKIPRYSNALKTLDENYSMLKNVVAKCVECNAKIVFSSTSDVYGKNKNLPFDEESDLVLGQTKIKRWAYALSKIYGEHYIIANNDEHGLKYTIVRFFGSYGLHQNLTWWGGPQSVFISKAFDNEPIEIHGDGLQTRTFTYVDDTVEALTHCVLNESANGEIYNIGSNAEDEISILDLATLIWRLVNGENSELKLKFIPYSNFGRYEDVMRRLPNIEKIKKQFGYEPKVHLEEGLQRTIEWQRNVG
ncbi:MAG: nucleoside-diphosphate sugar epimerase [Flavobacteriales bacterium]|nr:MAG: nucleoside-diphosphate sugar epimerase [Flavobacteriales bacterium]